MKAPHPAAGRSQASAPDGRLRIVGGKWRRRVLRFPSADGLRPTPDRVRETLFNWLGQDLTGRSCLDLFAGSGALGIEAASRGASRVVLVESAARPAAALAANLRLLDAGPTVELRRQDALEFALFCRDAFDIVFFDPPFHRGWIEKIGPHLPRLTHQTSLLYLESEAPVALDGWRILRSGKAGQSYHHLMQQDPLNDA